MSGLRFSTVGGVIGRTLLCVPVLLSTAACRTSTSSSAPAPASSPSGDTDGAEVVSVIDGDTVVLLMAGREETVRLLGIDAPESVHPSVPVQCFGHEASAALTDLLPPGTEVRVERDEELRDRYGRLLLFVVRREDDVLINLALVERGLADAVSYAPNRALTGRFAAARNRARAGGVGLWGACDGPDQPLR